ncbi:MBL fold metallo-hydrolase [Prochlorothrix hollandica]|uniref:MBL fold metallo-hydrolase n=1 Tax=Prochlorothrix hollandica TaxID=1223 RepID=UPI00069A552F|nr:MBL fold metallo-hydrolase [Prochlorothrix hollandica]
MISPIQFSRRFTPVVLSCCVGFVTLACTDTASTTDNGSAEIAATVAEAKNVTETPDEETASLSLEVVRGSEDNGNLVASTLIMGETEVILVDGQAKLSEAQQVVDAIEASGKTLKAIWVTHAHADHYFGLRTVLDAFPDTPVYSTPEVVSLVEERTPGYLKTFQERFPEDAPEVPVIPTAYTESTLEVDGEPIEIISFPRGDTEDVTVLHIPSIGAVLPGDIVYSGVHMYLREAPTVEDRMAWLETLDAIAALNPKILVAGHQSPDYADANVEALQASKDYITAFSKVVEENDSPETAQAAMVALYPDYKYPFLLEAALKAAYAQ